jgi:predicted pyridoxine 5'-phosphate oxidase superfamily flavin-nucleotide-binding protein
VGCDMNKYASDIAFTPAVKAIQSGKGSRSAYSKVEKGRGWQTKVTPELTVFLSELDMFYLGTANAEGQPYIQYRGGSPGFLKVMDDKTLGFADFGGHQQYLPMGNLSENPKAFIFLMDHAHSRRVKFWGSAHAVEHDPTLLDQLRDPSYPGEVERAILFTIKAWDVYCPQHIHKRSSQATVASEIKQLRSQVQELQAKLDKLENKEGHL